jgi:teichuronic acid biosynthesis glycosyltransferase TuaC
MSRSGWRVLTISDLYPSRPSPANGIFVERQVHHLMPYCDLLDVVVPLRVWPPLRIWKQAVRPRRFSAAIRQWASQLASIPACEETEGVTIYHRRYVSPPRQAMHGTWGFFAYAFLLRSLRFLYKAKNFNLVHAHYAVPSGTIGLLAKRWMRVPLVVSVHGSDLTYTVRQRPIGRFIVGWVLRNADAVLANSRWTAERIRTLGVPAGRINIVPYGADPPSVIPRGWNASGEIEVLTVAYLSERKGHAYVLRALSELVREGYRLRYIIVGSGDQEPRLRELAKSVGIQAIVHFEGYRRHEEVWGYMASCDMFVLPSWNEAFGVAYIEAMSLGKPVIGCAGEGGPEDLRALGECIELVRPRDADSLKRAMRNLIDDPARRDTLAENGRRIVQANYTWQANARLTLAAYEMAAGRRDP